MISAGESSYHFPCVVYLQAFDRAGGKAGNKGAETALTAVRMLFYFEKEVYLPVEMIESCEAAISKDCYTALESLRICNILFTI